MESIHKGHRERLRKRFSEHGLDSFSDIEALEMLLFYALPRRDTNELAHALLGRFGGFRAVMEASAADLAQVDGIGENAAYLIRLVAELGRRYMTAGRSPGRQIRSSVDAGEYFLPLFAYESSELVYVMCMDSGGMVRHCRRIARGMSNRVDFSSRDIIDTALRHNASHVIIAHNHLSGTALPSPADVSATKKLHTALSLIGVELDDHIIVCGEDYVSMRDSGYMNMT